MICQRCESGRVATMSAKCADRFYMVLDGKPTQGYVPSDLTNFYIYDGIRINVCLDCGQTQGTFPIPQLEAEQ